MVKYPKKPKKMVQVMTKKMVNMNKKVQEKPEYAKKFVIFPTKWGYFGLAGDEKYLLQAHLPVKNPEKIRAKFLRKWPGCRCEKGIFKELQRQIITYFEGKPVSFVPDKPLLLNGCSPFTRRVLTACKKIPFSRTMSYKRLAEVAGSPSAARAVGAVMAQNLLPLLIPCHRVIRADGQIGGFSAPDGTSLKKKLLLHEKNCLQ